MEKRVVVKPVSTVQRKREDQIVPQKEKKLAPFVDFATPMECAMWIKEQDDAYDKKRGEVASLRHRSCVEENFGVTRVEYDAWVAKYFSDEAEEDDECQNGVSSILQAPVGTVFQDTNGRMYRLDTECPVCRSWDLYSHSRWVYLETEEGSWSNSHQMVLRKSDGAIVDLDDSYAVVFPIQIMGKEEKNPTELFLASENR
ncbi:MAG: hypothetical protein WCX97_01145 [Candidatus Magasanikbacteria bacterium]